MSRLIYMMLGIAMLAGLGTAAEARRAPAVWSKGEDIELIAQLPADPEYSAGGERVSLGYKYNYATIFFMPVWADTSDASYVLFTGTGSDMRYMEVSADDMATVRAAVGDEAVDNYSFNILSHIWGAFIFGALLIWGIANKIRGKLREREMIEAANEMASKQRTGQEEQEWQPAPVQNPASIARAPVGGSVPRRSFGRKTV